MTGEPVHFFLHCALCGCRVEIDLEARPSYSPDPVQTWTCPRCGQLNSGQYGGEVAWVSGCKCLTANTR